MGRKKAESKIKKTLSPCRMKGRYGGKIGGPGQRGGGHWGSPRGGGCEIWNVCQGVFLEQTSEGTRQFRKKLGKKTRFRGCYLIEGKLVADIFVRHEPWQTLAGGADEGSFQMTETRDLAEKITLWDIARHIQAIKDNLRIYVDSTKLTFKQREAVELVYLENDLGLSDDVIAKKLGIGIDSLRDRLEAALKKIRAEWKEQDINYPERKMSKERAAVWKAPDYQMSGFWRKSNSKPGKVRHLRPTPQMIEQAKKTGPSHNFGLRAERPEERAKIVKRWVSLTTARSFDGHQIDSIRKPVIDEREDQDINTLDAGV